MPQSLKEESSGVKPLQIFTAIILPFWLLLFTVGFSFENYGLTESEISWIYIGIFLVSGGWFISGTCRLVKFKKSISRPDKEIESYSHLQPHSSLLAATLCGALSYFVFILYFPLVFAGFISDSESLTLESLFISVAIVVFVLLSTIYYYRHKGSELQFDQRGITLLKFKQEVTQLSWQELKEIQVKEEKVRYHTVYRLLFKFNETATNLKAFGHLRISISNPFNSYESFCQSVGRIVTYYPGLMDHLKVAAQNDSLAQTIFVDLQSKADFTSGERGFKNQTKLARQFDRNN